jgi:glycolate oxidase iron-sulfur subunit
MNHAQHEQDLMTCVHCGLCLNACPTYLETGSEADSPRGRIVLMRGLHEGKLSTADADVTHHLDLCLGCRACETACPSGVPYGRLLETARERINADHVRPPLTDAARHVLLDTLAHPKRMTIAMRFAKLTTGGAIPAPVAAALSGSPSIGDVAGQSVSIPETLSPPLPPAVTPAVGPRRYRVGMLTGCVMRVLFGDVNADTVRVLAANGCEVLVNRRQACCGALHVHNGCGEDARQMARALIDAFWPWDGLDAIIVNSAGCGSTMKEYGHLLADDPAYAAKAAAFAAKIRDVSEWLDESGWTAPLRPLSDEPLTIAYHDACHLAHGQGVRDAPRRLLAQIPGVRLVPLAESEICCGSAGIYNFTEPDMARRLQSRKLVHIRATGASLVATGNPGCLAWIQNGLKDCDTPGIRVTHPVTLLAEALDCTPKRTVMGNHEV